RCDGPGSVTRGRGRARRPGGPGLIDGPSHIKVGGPVSYSVSDSPPSDFRRPAGPWTGRRAGSLLVILVTLGVVQQGCAPSPRLVPMIERAPIERTIIEGPAGFSVQRYIANLTGATSIAFAEKD